MQDSETQKGDAAAATDTNEPPSDADTETVKRPSKSASPEADADVPADVAPSADAAEEDDLTEEEEEQEDPVAATGDIIRVLMKQFLDDLPKTINRELIDKAAVDFVTNLNTPGNRKKLVRALYTVHRNRLDLLPFYARLVAVLNPVMPDVGTELVQDLIRGFRREVRMKNQLHIETKTKIVRFIGELVKFRVFPKSEALHCLKMLLFDFRHHNIDMCCGLLETCGFFLYHSPDSHHKTKFLLEQMNRKKQSSHLDSRYQMMVENAYFQCNPPVGEGIAKIQRPPMHSYIMKLIYTDLTDSEKTVERSLRQIRKLDWNDPDITAYCIKCLSRPWNVCYDIIASQASLVAGVMYYYEDVGLAVVDNVLEDIRSGMEINDPKFNQRRMACVRYLGELYNYRVVDSGVIFNELYSIITFGVAFDPNTSLLLPSLLDPPEHLFRIRLACALLETCGHYFDRGSSKKKLDCYLVYLQRYYFAKREADNWNEERHPFPLEIDHVLDDTLEIIRSTKFKRFKSLSEATDAVKAIEEEYREKIQEALLAFHQQGAASAEDSDALDIIGKFSTISAVIVWF